MRKIKLVLRIQKRKFCRLLFELDVVDHIHARHGGFHRRLPNNPTKKL